MFASRPWKVMHTNISLCKSLCTDSILSQDSELDQFTNISFGKKDRHELTTSVEDSFVFMVSSRSFKLSRHGACKTGVPKIPNDEYCFCC